MVKDETLDKFGVRGEFMDHMHDFNHVEVDRFIGDLDDVDGIDDDVDKLVGELWMELATERSSCDTDQKWFLYSLLLDFELVQKFKGFLSGQFVAFSDDSGVYLLNC